MHTSKLSLLRSFVPPVECNIGTQNKNQAIGTQSQKVASLYVPSTSTLVALNEQTDLIKIVLQLLKLKCQEC